ncbi:hypothetical protein CHS0354_030833 [Potamilus streckersoni]|uniref:Fanconi-associated nuclease n=1 Tax=Potamilus streckersoni TaxID=2493646 RepID=A0AAE0WBC9_9BIVA|nr:hypothetical protein CHS0354_030833 [Potamilus streckersoni]
MKEKEQEMSVRKKLKLSKKSPVSEKSPREGGNIGNGTTIAVLFERQKIQAEMRVKDAEKKPGCESDSDIEIVHVEINKNKQLFKPGNSFKKLSFKSKLSLHRHRTKEAEPVVNPSSGMTPNKSPGSYNPEAMSKLNKTHDLIEVKCNSNNSFQEDFLLCQKDKSETADLAAEERKPKRSLSLRKRPLPKQISCTKITLSEPGSADLKETTLFQDLNHLKRGNHDAYVEHQGSSPMKISKYTSDPLSADLKHNSSLAVIVLDDSSSEGHKEHLKEAEYQFPEKNKILSNESVKKIKYSPSMDRTSVNKLTKNRINFKPDCSHNQNNEDVGEDNMNKSSVSFPVRTNLSEDETKKDGEQSSDSGEVLIDPKILYKVPYYLENFKMILHHVLQDEDNIRLFNEDDLQHINVFNNLTESSQKLYVRLFSRKLAWLQLSKLNYPEIANDFIDQVEELIAARLLISDASLHDLETTLTILSAPDLKALAKTFHLSFSGESKAQLKENLLKKSRQRSIGALFQGVNSKISMEETMLQRAKDYLGKSCRLVEEPRSVFIRVLMLFSLINTNYDEDSGSGGQNQIFQMLMVNAGKVVYPSYTVNKQTPVFKDRDMLVRFEEALQCEVEVLIRLERKDYLRAYEVCLEAEKKSKELLKKEENMEWDKNLPMFLRSYTPLYVYYRVRSQAVDILQRSKKYMEAVHLLQELLSQTVYCPNSRGWWWDRLALNLDVHLKSTKQSLEMIKEGLADPFVKTGHRLSLYQRAEKICNAPKSPYLTVLAELQHYDVLEAPKVYIDGPVMPDATAMGMKYKFIMRSHEEEEFNEGITLCAVEELALEHYKQNGYTEGVHAEGSIVSNLFTLLFWDVIFMDIADAFHSPFQTHPLDLETEEFYLRRKQQIDDRLFWIRSCTEEELAEAIQSCWENHSGKMCAGMNWDKYSSPKMLQDLVMCMGGGTVSGILERYILNPRHTRGGFPDLTCWNIKSKAVKIAEVKGPGDRLSHKQILWLDYLLKLGVDAEVCHVKAVGAKKLKPFTVSV